MKVLHVLESSHFSGAENVACQIIDMMRGFSNIESAYCSRDGAVRLALNSRNITFFPVAKMTPKELGRIVKEYQPDVIHAHDMRATAIATLVAGRVKVVSHIHNSDFRARKISLKSLAFLLCSHKLSSIIWVSNSCFNSYIFHNTVAHKSHILYNVINSEQTYQKAISDSLDYDYDMVYIGRLDNPKNPLRLVRIIDLVRQQKSDVKVGIVGTGSLEQVTKKAVDEFRLNNNVIFHGYMNNPLKVLKSAKVMVLTSDREGLPMVALEAMSMGIPIVSTPTDGMCDIVKVGVTGYLESDESSFAERVLSLLDDHDKRERFSSATLDEFRKINDIEHYRKVISEVYGRKQLG